MIDHGGDLDRAISRYGGRVEEWLDLSTGINRLPYPVPPISAHAWTALPTKADISALCGAARSYYGASGSVVALAGAQSAIQMLPSMLRRGTAKIVGPTYNEYQRAFTSAGWRVEIVRQAAELAGADIGIVVNPNNPDGRIWSQSELLAARDRVGLLVVDESFMDATPEGSLADHTHHESLLVLRSFGKFFGLAGIRLGFALGSEQICAKIADGVGPWPISGAAIEIGLRAMSDLQWSVDTRALLARLSSALDEALPWHLAGGTSLFRLYDVGAAKAVQHALARQRIWTRAFPWSDNLLRIGVGSADEIARLASAARRAEP